MRNFEENPITVQELLDFIDKESDNADTELCVEYLRLLKLYVVNTTLFIANYKNEDELIVNKL